MVYPLCKEVLGAVTMEFCNGVTIVCKEVLPHVSVNISVTCIDDLLTLLKVNRKMYLAHTYVGGVRFCMLGWSSPTLDISLDGENKWVTE